MCLCRNPDDRFFCDEAHIINDSGCIMLKLGSTNSENMNLRSD